MLGTPGQREPHPGRRIVRGDGPAGPGAPGAAAAGQYFYQRQEWEKAAKYYLKAEDKASALACYETHLRDLPEPLPPGTAAGTLPKDRPVGRPARTPAEGGRLLRDRPGHPRRGAILHPGGNFIRAAELLLAGGEIDQALKILNKITADHKQYTVQPGAHGPAPPSATSALPGIVETLYRVLQAGETFRCHLGRILPDGPLPGKTRPAQGTPATCLRGCRASGLSS